MPSPQIGVLASGRGTTLQAVIDATRDGSLAATVAVVISNDSKSGAAQRARRQSIAFAHLSARTHRSPADLDRAIGDTLQRHEVDLVLLAGYMKKLGAATLHRYRNRVLNTHPALLPRHGGRGMYGAHVHEAVLAAGDDTTGVSVHLVGAQYDTGPVVAQSRVPVLSGDDVPTLAARVQEHERRFLVQVLQGIADGRVVLPAGLAGC